MTQTQSLTRKQLRELRAAQSAPIEPVLPAQFASQHPNTAAQPVRPAPLSAPAAPLSRREAREREQLRASAALGTAPLVGSEPRFEQPAPAPQPPFTSTRELRRSRREHETAPPSRDYVVPAPQLSPQQLIQTPVSAPAEVALLATPAPAPLVTREEVQDHYETSSSQRAGSTALIYNRGADAHSITGPIASTGEVLITGYVELPESLGSVGHAPGTTDGKDTDAVLFDRELAASSSPAPVAASAAISTIKPAGEVMRQPTPEKVGGLPMALALTAGGLTITLTVVIIMAFMNGLF